jgi:quinol monooxygenase YgiN
MKFSNISLFVICALFFKMNAIAEAESFKVHIKYEVRSANLSFFNFWLRSRILNDIPVFKKMGAKDFTFLENKKHRNIVYVSQEWDTKANFEAHLKTPEMYGFNANVNQVLVRPPQVLEALDVGKNELQQVTPLFPASANKCKKMTGEYKFSSSENSQFKPNYSLIKISLNHAGDLILETETVQTVSGLPNKINSMYILDNKGRKGQYSGTSYSGSCFDDGNIRIYGYYVGVGGALGSEQGFLLDPKDANVLVEEDVWMPSFGKRYNRIK